VSVSDTEAAIDRLLAAAEPDSPRALAELIDRLRAADLVRGARRDDLPTGAAALRDVEVTGLTDDSRSVQPGSLFVAVPGFHVDGHDFVVRSAAAGAAAALVEHPVAATGLPQLVVSASRAALARASGWWYGDPSRGLGTIGITGTDGKTTTSFLAVAALEAAGVSTGLIGTVETRIGAIRDRHAAHVTTPGAPELQQALAAMALAGNEAAVVEATSHALALDRVLGVAWDAAVFTNLSHEHLDLHGTFEAYRAAKLRLFRALGGGPDGDDGPAKTVAGRPWPKVAVVNRDDPAAPWFEAAAHEARAAVVTYGADAAATVRATAVEEDARRLRVAYAAPSGHASLELRLAGRFNVHNALAVVALGEGLGLDPAAVRAGLESVEGVPGRMERIDEGQPFAVVVDYAHSPASLKAVLDLLAPVAAAGGGGVIAVFGSAGERDTAKRAVMGRIAAERCRLVVATDEDPRGEDPDAILREIVRGAESAGGRAGVDVLAVRDRREAITAAFERATTGDVVLLAGKGHEASILYSGGSIRWDEAAVAREALAALGYRGA
jgi:UDP-N-acetylmuramoyl-L-alanyl-D-glutamate--2,6-diaminopimelate ligase